MALCASVLAQTKGDDTPSQPRPDNAQGQPGSGNSVLTLETIQREIERVARAIEAQKDEADARKKNERESSDLKAQWEMARWAENMFYVAVATAILTTVGILLIWRTLVQTRRAAISAEQMVVEANLATSAANSAASEAKRQADLSEQSFLRLQRPYIYIFGVHQIETDGSMSNFVKYSVANFGKEPAQITILAVGMSTHPEAPTDTTIVDYRDDPAHDLLVRPILPPNDIRQDLRIAPPGGIPFHKPKPVPDVFTLGDQYVAPVLENGEQFFVWIRISYSGPAGRYMTNACWRYDSLTKCLVPWGYHDEQYNSMI